MNGLVAIGLLGMLVAMSGLPLRPGRAEILKKAVACGLTPDNLSFSVDSEGVDNVDVFPVGEPDEKYFESVHCMIEWAAKSGAAVGLHLKRRAS